MHDVLANGQGEVTADGARGGLGDWVGAASQLAPCLDGALALNNTSDKRCGGDELDEVAEEWLVLVLLVVLLRGLAVSNAQVELGQLQALALDAGDDFAYVAVLYAVRLDENQSCPTLYRNRTHASRAGVFLWGKSVGVQGYASCLTISSARSCEVPLNHRRT